MVHGEVYALNNPVSALKWLDAYEGIVPGAHDRNEYERVERPVRLASGEQITAWVYLYRKDVAPFRLIPDGRWALRLALTKAALLSRHRAAQFR